MAGWGQGARQGRHLRRVAPAGRPDDGGADADGRATRRLALALALIVLVNLLWGRLPRMPWQPADDTATLTTEDVGADGAGPVAHDRADDVTRVALRRALAEATP